MQIDIPDEIIKTAEELLDAVDGKIGRHKNKNFDDARTAEEIVKDNGYFLAKWVLSLKDKKK